MQNCSSIYASLHNTDIEHASQKTTLEVRDVPAINRLEFRPVPRKTRPASPVSLVSRIDESEHKYYHRSGKGLVAIAAADLDASVHHVIRILAVQDDDDREVSEGIQFEGIWLNDGGALIFSQKESTEAETVIGTALLPLTASAKLSKSSVETIGRDKIRSSLESQHLLSGHRKTVEIASDLPRILRDPVNNESLAALKGYGDLIGDIFGVDHVNTALDGMCLVSPCIGGTGQPASVGDAFFRRYCAMPCVASHAS